MVSVLIKASKHVSGYMTLKSHCYISSTGLKYLLHVCNGIANVYDMVV